MIQIKLLLAAAKDYRGIHAADLPIARIEHEGETRIQVLIRAHGAIVSDTVAHLTLSQDDARHFAVRILNALDSAIERDQ